MDESGTDVLQPATERPWEVFMSSRSGHGTTWNPLRESAILGILCVLLPVVFLGQVIALVYAGGPA
jgi:hypothetical protein